MRIKIKPKKLKRVVLGEGYVKFVTEDNGFGSNKSKGIGLSSRKEWFPTIRSLKGLYMKRVRLYAEVLND